jgi:CheY-like chemotaxis protein
MNSDSQPETSTPPRDLSQELRTGLNDIVGFASVLESRANSADRESLQRIVRAGRQMLDLLGGNLPQPEKSNGSYNGQTAADAVQKVLYVEDNDANFMLMSRILESRPTIELIRAPLGETAVKLAAEFKPDLVLLDLNLPDFPGSEVLRRLRADSTTEAIPVIVISADATPSQIEKLLSAGARNYLTKPFSIEILLAVVDEALAENAAPVVP